MTIHRLTQITTIAIIADTWLILAVRAVWHILRGLL
jgi:hypothetical protein